MISTENLELLRSGLFSGQYNLLLGSGVSLDSYDKSGGTLKSVATLTEELCNLKGVGAGTRLQRVSLLLDSNDVDNYLTKPYVRCRAGETVKRLTSYVWRSIFTFNIDDALEAAYESNDRSKQKIESLNYDALYQTQSNRLYLSIIHLHGFAREPEKGYVFSASQYAQATRNMCAWTHILSELIATEPFIVSGTSLDEPDLEYYLAGRTSVSGRTNRVPSFLVEPSPNKITEALCKQHGLVLVQAKLGEFLKWLLEQLGNAPSITQITVPSLDGIFRAKPIPEDQINFFSRFELVRPATHNPEGDIPEFYFGKPGRWSDFESSLDVPSNDERIVSAKARNWLNGEHIAVKVITINGMLGSGKTTILRRSGYNLAKDGNIVLCLKTNAVIDLENTSNLLSLINRPVAMLVDGVATHAPSLRSMVEGLRLQKPLVIICADRDYRKAHIDRIVGDLDIEYLDVLDWSADSFERLITRLHRAGLLGNVEAVHNPKKFANELLNDPVAIATCRALNNFRPLESIVKSLWNDANANDRRSYIIAGLAQNCYAGGILYPILERAFPNPNLKDQLKRDCPLPLTFIDEDNYVVPMYPVVADRLLVMLAREKPDFLLAIFSSLAKALAPYVNRRTAIERTPEAKLAARLFSADHVATPFLGANAEIFFNDARDAWQWNSRYWEQRAILTQSGNLDLAIQYARHAVAIEEHPFPWTTLASLLAKRLEDTTVGITSLYTEIIDILNKVFKYEASVKFWRPTPHPYVALFNATDIFLSKGGKLPPKKINWIIQQIEFCSKTFSRDDRFNEHGKKILERLTTV